MTQELLGKVLGLTAVHVNRKLEWLRKSGSVDSREGQLHVHDFPRRGGDWSCRPPPFAPRLSRASVRTTDRSGFLGPRPAGPSSLIPAGYAGRAERHQS